MVRRLFGRGGDKSDEQSGPSRRVLDPANAATPAPAAAVEPAAEQPEAPGPGSRGMILVRHPDGAESRLPVSVKPVTIGSWEQCDIPLDDQSIRPVHVRIAPQADGEFRIHGLAAPSLRPFATNIERPDEFMVVHSGDEVTLPGEAGDYVIHFLSTEAAAQLDDAGTATAAADGSPQSPEPPAAGGEAVEPPAETTQRPPAAT